MMDSIRDKIESIIKRAFDHFDGIEFIFFSIIAGLTIVGGPIYLIFRFINQGNIWQAIAIIIVVCACVYYCVRDYRKKKFSWISIIIVVAWILLTIVLSIMIYF